MLEWQLGSCRFRIHFFFAAMLVLLLFTDGSGTALSSLLAALLHEGGHLLTMLLCRVPPVQVDFRPFGVVIQERSSICRSYRSDLLIALGGPCANGIAVLVSLFFSQGTSAQAFLVINGVLGGFNLLPAEGLDGGRALYSLLCLRLQPDHAKRISRMVSLCCVIPMLLLGLVLLLSAGRNPTLLLAAVYLMVCLLLKKE